MNNKHMYINSLLEKVTQLTHSPLYEYRKEHNYVPVIGDGSLDAQIVFVGEAPGKKEAETGKPFQGAAGKMLNTLLASISLERSDIYITNVVHDRPPENRDPTKEEIALYAPILVEVLSCIRPKAIATLGRHSLSFLLTHFKSDKKTETISTLHGIPIPVHAEWGEIVILPLYHPAYALYNGSKRDILLADIQRVVPFLT